MNTLSSRRLALRPYRWALPICLLAALPVATLAQKPVATPPAVAATASSFAPTVPAPRPPPEGAAAQEMLIQDTRLDRLISLDVISVPLDEVLRKESLDKSTETMEDGHRFLLTAAPDCANLKLQIRLNNRPLRTMMMALAQMVPGVWTRTTHGYQFAMTKQAAAARAEWWRLFLGERDKVLALQRQAVLAAMQTKANRRKASDQEQSDQAIETDVANQHDFFHSLPPALKQQIAANIDDSAFYQVGRMSFGNAGEQTGEIGRLSQMSQETQEKFKAAMQNTVNRLAQAPPAYRGYATQAQKDLAAFDPGKVYFLFQNGGFVVYATPFNCPPSIGGGLDLDLHVPMVPTTPALSLNQAMLAGAVEKMGAAAPDEWKRLAAYQRSHVWPNILPKLVPEDQSTWHPTVSRAAQIDWLGEKGHMEYVSDYYSHGGYSMPTEQRKLPIQRPLAKEMDEIAAKRDVSWTKDTDGIYLIRNDRWYRDDGLEVPQPLLRRWFAPVLQARQEKIARQQAAAQPASPQSPQERTAALRQIWDWAAEVFGTLTPWQMRTGLAMFQPEEKDLAAQNDSSAAKLNEKLKHSVPQGISTPGFDAFAAANRNPPFWLAITMLEGYPLTAQLYGSLDDAGRTALLEGRFPAWTLSAPQLAQAVSLQPQLPQAMQSFPADSVLLGLLDHSSASDRVAFGDMLSPTRLEVFTPPPPASQNAP